MSEFADVLTGIAASIGATAALITAITGWRKENREAAEQRKHQAKKHGRH